MSTLRIKKKKSPLVAFGADGRHNVVFLPLKSEWLAHVVVDGKMQPEDRLCLYMDFAKTYVRYGAPGQYDQTKECPPRFQSANLLTAAQHILLDFGTTLDPKITDFFANGPKGGDA